MRNDRSYTRRLLRENFRRFIRVNGWRLAWIGILIAGSAVLAALVEPPFAGGVITGVMATFYVGVIFFAFLIHTEGLQQLAGAWGEDNTAAELEKARKRGLVWGFVNNLEIGNMDIDHVVVAPAGVFAVESKWHFRESRESTLEYNAFQAQRNAEKIASILRSVTVRMPHPVTPIVAVWGRGRHELPSEGRTVSSVLVAPGDELALWLERLQTGRFAQDYAAELLSRLTAFKAEQRLGREPLPTRRRAWRSRREPAQ